MNSIISRPVAFPALVTFGLTIFLLPLAVLHQGEMGLRIVATAASTVVAIVLVTALAQLYFCKFSAHPLKRLALVGGLRMGLSLAVVLAVCVAARQLAQPEVLLYAVPFYLGLLAAESAVMVGQVRESYRG